MRLFRINSQDPNDARYFVAMSGHGCRYATATPDGMSPLALSDFAVQHAFGKWTKWQIMPRRVSAYPGKHQAGSDG
jgi:hypothetical protein